MCLDSAALGNEVNTQRRAGNGETAEKYEALATQNVTGLWEWQHQNGWLPFDAPLCDKLEDAWQAGSSLCTVPVGTENYNVNFSHMWQQNNSTHTTRPVRRSMYKEAPAWYWWDKDGRHRLEPTATMLLEQEYQKTVCGEEQTPREVIYHVEGGSTFLANVATMQLTPETGGQSFPISRSLIKAGVFRDGDAETRWGSSPDEESVTAVQVPTPGAARVSTAITGANSQGRQGDTSVHISVERASVSIHLSEGRSANIHISDTQPLLHQRQQSEQIRRSSSCKGTPCYCCYRVEKPFCCSGYSSHCQSSNPCDRRTCCYQGCGCSSFSCVCRGSQSGKRLCSGEVDAAASQCNLLRQHGESDSVKEVPEGTQVGVTASAEEGVDTQEPSQSPTPSATSQSTPQQEEQQPQTQEQGSLPTVVTQQQLLLEGALEQQQCQVLLQEEHLKKQSQLEQQQEKLYQQQQQLVHELQLQHDQLIQKQAEVRDQQRQLEHQHAEQQELLRQQAAEVQQLRAAASRVSDASGSPREEEQQVRCDVTETETKRQQLHLRHSESPASRVATDPSAATEAYLSPVNEERAGEDEYMCL